MERFLMKSLMDWKDSSRRKPLILNGARQVGKTWLLKEFGRIAYQNVAYVTLDNNPEACELFRHGYNVQRILESISLITGEKITQHDTLVIIDEIQAEPRAITSLKYFCENTPGVHIATAGSLLGISASEGTGYPVGKVNTLDLHPLSFREFILATEGRQTLAMLTQGDEDMLSAFSQRLIGALKRYYIVGGMPEAVNVFIDSKSLEEVRTVQQQILQDYMRDFAKHIPIRILQNTVDAWQSIPAHLSQENKKFMFGRIRPGSRAKDYEESLLWLSQAGLITTAHRVSKPGMPLAAYDDHKSFKVFLLDVGLISAMAQLDPTSVVEGNRIFTEFKGALTEQYVCQQLVSDCALTPYYWSAENSQGEIDFLVQRNGKTYPIEVKAEENLRAKSLRAFSQKYPDMHPVRFSLSSFREESWMQNVPLYAVGCIERWGS